MTDGKAPTAYRLCIAGQLGEQWATWLGQKLITFDPDPRTPEQTLITATVPDQAALRGILNKLWDLNLTLISVSPAGEPLDGDHSDEKLDS